MGQTKRQSQKENTRKRIIEKAYDIYSQNGFSATTSLIAKEANVSHGTIFVHFPTLDDLIITLINEFENAIGEKLHILSSKKNTIKDVLKAHLSVLEEYEDFYRQLITEANLLPDEAKHKFTCIQSTIAFHFGIVIEREVDAKNIKDISIHMVFNTWIGLVHYYLQNKKMFAPNSSVLQKYKQELIDTLLVLIKQ